MPYFINRTDNGNGYRETVDEYGTREDAEHDLIEYRMSDPAGSYKVSTRHCSNWLS